MLKEIRFALFAIKKNIQNSSELRTSFWMNIIGMAINNISFLFLWIYFVKSVGVIGGWTTYDIIGLQGFSSICYGIVLFVAGGIRNLPDYVNSGTFDQFMLSPKNILSRVATSSIVVSALGDILFGAICIILYLVIIKISFLQLGLTLLLILLTIVFFFSMLVFIYSISFYFIDSETVVGGVFQFFFTPSLFHGGAFQGVMRFIFIFIIPSLLVGAIPVEIIKDASLKKLMIMIFLTFFWLFISIKFFKKSLKKYESANYMTFGV